MKKVFALMLAVSLVALGLSTASAGAVLDKIKSSGELVLGTEATYPPYEFLDANTNFAGSDIWLAQKIADALGVTLKVQDMAFDGIIPAVQAGQIDIGLAGITRTEDRAKVVDFSTLYEQSTQLLIVKKGNADVYASAEALKGLKVGAQMGSIQSQLVMDTFPDSELFELDTYPNLALETINGNIAGFVLDEAVGLSMVAASDQLEVAAYAFPMEEGGVGKAAAMPKGDAEFLAAVNEVIEAVLADGSYQAAYDEAVALSAQQ